MGIPRCNDWPERLDEALQRAARLPFAWGRHDCCLFAADVCRAITGLDPAADLRGRYGTVLEAFKLLDKRFCGGVAQAAEALAARAGWPEVRPGFARRGDVALVMDDEGLDALGVVDMNGTHVAVLRPDKGLARHPLARARRAWGIGSMEGR